MKSALICIAVVLLLLAPTLTADADETGGVTGQQSSQVADGRITSVFREMIDAYVINLSTRDGVVFGDTFEVRRNGEIIAKALVVKEMPGSSVICVKGEALKKCAVGDTVKFVCHRKQIASAPAAKTAVSYTPTTSTPQSAKPQSGNQAAGRQGVSISIKECVKIVDERDVTRAMRVYATVTNGSDSPKSNISALCNFRYRNGSVYRVDEVKVDKLSPGESKEVIFYCEKEPQQSGGFNTSLDALVPRDNGQVTAKSAGAGDFDGISPSVNVVCK